MPEILKPASALRLTAPNAAALTACTYSQLARFLISMTFAAGLASCSQPEGKAQAQIDALRSELRAISISPDIEACPFSASIMARMVAILEAP